MLQERANSILNYNSNDGSHGWGGCVKGCSNHSTLQTNKMELKWSSAWINTDSFIHFQLETWTTVIGSGGSVWGQRTILSATLVCFSRWISFISFRGRWKVWSGSWEHSYSWPWLVHIAPRQEWRRCKRKMMATFPNVSVNLEAESPEIYIIEPE